MKNKYRYIKETIDNMPNGSFITISDYKDMVKEKTIGKFLDRISKENKIEKIMRGIYWKKNDKPFKADELAYAIARSKGWDIAPSGDSALFLYGLKDNEPKKWTFVSNGSCRKYKLGDKCISLTHTSGKLLKGLSNKTKLLVQVIKALGKNSYSSLVKDKFNKYSKEEKETIIKETNAVTTWIKKYIMNIFSKEGSAEYE